MSDMDPDTAARVATESAGAGDVDMQALPEPSTAQSAETGGSGTTLIDGLLETRPPGSVAEYPDMPDAAAHALIGAQKFVNGIAGDRDMSGGKPAVVDFMQAAVSFLSGDAYGHTDEPRPSESDSDDGHLVGQTGADAE